LVSTILVVDDERLIRWSLKDRLVRAGHTVLEAGDAAQARRTLAGGSVDLVVLDLRLPDSDDLSLLTRIRAATPAPAVILMTAHGTHDVADEALKLGASRFVGKPFDLDEMVGYVAAALAPPGAPATA
jgi:DNA-binding NtrC family response regulator